MASPSMIELQGLEFEVKFGLMLLQGPISNFQVLRGSGGVANVILSDSETLSSA